MAKKEQRVFTQEFKREAIQLAETSGKSMTQIARDWGISDSALHAWRKQFAAHGNQAFPGKGHQTELEEENRRLRRENDILKQEREVLKKAVRIFAQSQLWNFSSFKLTVGSIPLRWCTVLWSCPICSVFTSEHSTKAEQGHMHAEMLNRTTEEEEKTMSIPQQRVYYVAFVVTYCWSEAGRFIFYYY
jgi:transposase